MGGGVWGWGDPERRWFEARSDSVSQCFGVIRYMLNFYNLI